MKNLITCIFLTFIISCSGNEEEDFATLDSAERGTVTDGTDGTDGANGANGTNGTDGIDGGAGGAGGAGPQGLQGIPGNNGINGMQGIPGNDGSDGNDGNDGNDGTIVNKYAESGLTLSKNIPVIVSHNLDTLTPFVSISLNTNSAGDNFPRTNYIVIDENTISVWQSGIRRNFDADIVVIKVP